MPVMSTASDFFGKSPRPITVIQTSKYTDDRLSEKEKLFFEEDVKGEERRLVQVYEDVEYQTIMGFGGAFTEAASVTLDKLSKEKRNEILERYFDPEKGIGYSLCRTHINSCDFALGNYAYVEDPNDTELKTFSVERDKRSLIPFIREAMDVCKKTGGRDLMLFASPWSPPAWMKTNGKMNEGGKLKEEYRETWARYFAKYIKTYEKEGVPIWGVTVQNEPKARQRWDSCLYTAEEERDFVKYYLGPTLEKEGLGHVKIMVWDHNKERVYERSKTILSDKDASKYVSGVAFHWYSGDHFEALDAVHRMYPDKFLLHTEGCTEGGDKIGSWESGEKYAHDMIGDFNNWANGWVDWNLLLDEMGGPNHVGNYCAAPVIADTRTGEVTYESSYYYIGHLSKYVKPGAKRIGCSKYTDRLETVAFKNPDGTVAVIVMNRGESPVPFSLRTTYGIAKTECPPRSIMTLLY